MLKSRCSVIASALLFAWLAGAAPVVHADEPLKTNLDVMSDLTAEVIEKLLADIPSNVDKDVTLLPYDNTENYSFIENVFQRVLTSNGYKTHTSIAMTNGPGGNRNPTINGLVVEYQTLNFNLKYAKIYRSYLIGGKKVQRKADLKLVAKVLDLADDSVVWVGEAESSYEDSFPYGRISEVEDGEFAFTKPSRGGTNWGKVAEPVVVTGIIVGLIYLFFSNQTD